jgi:hypothetical protein
VLQECYKGVIRVLPAGGRGGGHPSHTPRTQVHVSINLVAEHEKVVFLGESDHFLHELALVDGTRRIGG